MSKYATGKWAYGISDRSGFRYRLRDMRKEWNGLLVGKDEWEAKQPQLEPLRARPDPQALKDPRPEHDISSMNNIQWGWNPVGYTGDKYGFTGNNLVANAYVGVVTTSVTQGIDTSVSAVGTSASGAVGTATNGSVTVSPAGINGTGQAGSVSVTVNTNFASPSGVLGTGYPGSTTVTTNIFAVTVASGTNPYGTGNKFYLDGAVSPTISIAEGSTFRFDQSASSNSSHPLRFSTTANGTHAGGSEYTTGVTTSGTAGQAGAYVQITVANSAPTLYYYCSNHSGMDGTANTP